jgi:hypothetical protein
MLDATEVLGTEANPITEVAKLQEGAAVEGKAAAQGMQVVEETEAVAKPKPGEPVQERMPTVEEKPQQAAELGQAHEVHAEATEQLPNDAKATPKLSSQELEQLCKNIIIDEKRVKHIFRDSEGHFPIDTLENRRLLLETAINPNNYLGADVHGNHWFAQVMENGIQIWVQVRNSKICYGGFNNPPKINFDKLTGLCNPIRPGK